MYEIPLKTSQNLTLDNGLEKGISRAVLDLSGGWGVRPPSTDG